MMLPFPPEIEVVSPWAGKKGQAIDVDAQRLPPTIFPRLQIRSFPLSAGRGESEGEDPFVGQSFAGGAFSFKAEWEEGWKGSLVDLSAGDAENRS